jgi:uncharacterized membrane protein
MSPSTIIGIILVILAVFSLIHHMGAYHLKLNPKWKKKIQAIETAGWYGPFYINKNDKRVFLPKRWGWGFTINLGSPVGFILTVALFAYIIWALASGH